MSDKPKRRWFRFHLSTAVVLMFVAGLLLLANIMGYLFYEWHHIDNITGQGSTYYGFPLCCYSTTGLSYDPASHWNTRIVYAVFNLCFALGILLAVALLLEYIIRRQEANRRWLQIRLSTLVLLVLVAGGLMGANFLSYHEERSVQYYGETAIENVQYWGWPLVAAYAYKYSSHGKELAPEIDSSDRYGYLPERIIGDVLAAIVILVATAVLSEYVIRRREARKP